MFCVISVEPLAASVTFRDISLVVALCSSTAVAMVLEMSLIWLMTAPMVAMASTAPLVSVWIAAIFWLMSSVALAVCLASSLTSLATTANPLPASPARAASIVAFKASRLVCWAMEVMTLMTWPISALDTPSLEMVALVDSAVLTALAGDASGFGGVLGDVLNGGAHFLGAGGDGLQVAVDLVGGGGNDVGLGGGFLGIGSDLLADGGEFLAGVRHLLRVFRNGNDHLYEVALHLVHGSGQVAEFVVAVYFDFFACQVACGNGFRLIQDGGSGCRNAAAHVSGHHWANSKPQQGRNQHCPAHRSVC